MDKRLIDEITAYYENRLFLAASKHDISEIEPNKYSAVLSDYLKVVPENKELVKTVEAIESLERCRGLWNSFGVSCARNWLEDSYKKGFLDALFFTAMLESGYYELDPDEELSLKHFNEYVGKGGKLPLPYDDFKAFIEQNKGAKIRGDERREKEWAEEREKEYNLHVTSGKAGMDPDLRAEYARNGDKKELKENAILIRQLDVLKVEVDFSNDNDLYRLLDAERVSVIHTKRTQELSERLGIHLVGYVKREGDDINNKLACSISGYNYIGSFMLLFKTDDKFNNLPLNEDELELVYGYLTSEDDAVEEVSNGEPSEDDLLLRYLLIIDAKIDWPNIKNYGTAYKLCVPIVYLEGKENVNIPYLNDAIEYLGIDRINDVLELKLHLGEDKEVKLCLNKPQKFEFAYQKHANDERSYRKGVINLELRRYVWVSRDFNGRISIKEEFHSNKREQLVEEKTFVDYRDNSEEVLASSVSGNIFYPLLIDTEQQIVVVYAYRRDYEDNDIIVNTYFPIELGRETIYHDIWKDEETGEKFDQKITMKYER